MIGALTAAVDLRRGVLLSGGWVIRTRRSTSGVTVFVTVVSPSGSGEFSQPAGASLSVFTLEDSDRLLWLSTRPGSVPAGPYSEREARRQWERGRPRRLLYGSRPECTRPAFPAWALPPDPREADRDAEMMIRWVIRMAHVGEWSDTLAANPECRTFNAVADVHHDGLWQAAGYTGPPGPACRALAPLVEELVNARLRDLPPEALRPAGAS